MRQNVCLLYIFLSLDKQDSKTCQRPHGTTFECTHRYSHHTHTVPDTWANYGARPLWVCVWVSLLYALNCFYDFYVIISFSLRCFFFQLLVFVCFCAYLYAPLFIEQLRLWLLIFLIVNVIVIDAVPGLCHNHSHSHSHNHSQAHSHRWQRRLGTAFLAFLSPLGFPQPIRRVYSGIAHCGQPHFGRQRHRVWNFLRFRNRFLPSARFSAWLFCLPARRFTQLQPRFMAR